MQKWWFTRQSNCPPCFQSVVPSSSNQRTVFKTIWSWTQNWSDVNFLWISRRSRPSSSQTSTSCYTPPDYSGHEIKTEIAVTVLKSHSSVKFVERTWADSSTRTASNSKNDTLAPYTNRAGRPPPRVMCTSSLCGSGILVREQENMLLFQKSAGLFVIFS